MIKLYLVVAALVGLAGCSKPDVFYCEKTSKLCYGGPNAEIDLHKDINYVALPTAYCLSGYVNTYSDMGIIPYKFCYPTKLICQDINLNPAGWVPGVGKPCTETYPSQGGSGFDLEENKQQSHM